MLANVRPAQLTFVSVTEPAPVPPLILMVGSRTLLAVMVRTLVVLPVRSIVAVPGLRVNPVVVAMFQTVVAAVLVRVQVPEPIVMVRVLALELSKVAQVTLKPLASNVAEATPKLPMTICPEQAKLSSSVVVPAMDKVNCTAAGVTAEPLVARVAPGRVSFSGRWGVFSPGNVRLRLFDVAGDNLRTIDLAAGVTPLKPVTIQATVDAPAGLVGAVLELTDKAGQVVGELARVSVPIVEIWLAPPEEKKVSAPR